MNLRTNGSNHLVITNGMREAIDEKLSILDKFLGENEKVSVTISSVKKEIKIAILFVYNNQTIKVVEKGDDFYFVLDELVDVLKNRMEKLHSFKTKQKRDQEKAFETFEITASLEEPKDDEYPEIVKEKVVAKVPMTEKEAKQQMIENAYNSFIFINADKNNEYCSLYWRNDGQLGLIMFN